MSVESSVAPDHRTDWVRLIVSFPGGFFVDVEELGKPRDGSPYLV